MKFPEEIDQTLGKNGGGYENGVGGRVVYQIEIRVDCWQQFEQFESKKSKPDGTLESEWCLQMMKCSVSR